MSGHNDGGPAFPAQPIQHFPDGSAIVQEQGGMTLRDYFAAKAMAAFVIAGVDECARHDGKAAQFAYALADAMLAARGEE